MSLPRNPVKVGKGKRKQLKKKSGSGRSPSSVIVFDRLPRPRYSDGECYYCNHYPNPTKRAMTDVGMRSVVQCSACLKFMRPYRS